MDTRTRWALAVLGLALTTTTPAVAQEYETREVEVVEVEDDDAWAARIRFGISGLGGGQWAGGPDLGMGGAALRLGVQLGDWLALYYQPTGLIASIVDRDPGRDSIAGQMWNTGMIEVTLFDMLQIGGGPSADFIWGCDESIQDEVACANSDVAFGLDGRVALVFGGMGDPGSRQGFVIEARVHPTWYDEDDASIAVLGGLGFEVY